VRAGALVVAAAVAALLAGAAGEVETPAPPEPSRDPGAAESAASETETEAPPPAAPDPDAELIRDLELAEDLELLEMLDLLGPGEEPPGK